jgi:hypothetical protein
MTLQSWFRRGLVLVAGCLVVGLVTLAPPSVQAQQKDDPLPGFQVPDIEKLFPPGSIDPEQLKMLKKLLEANQADLNKMMDQLKKQFPQGFPGGPGFPNMQLPGVMPFASIGTENRLGAVLQQPNATLVDQLELPDQQGLVLKTVKPGSAAAKAGLKSNDILLELAGKPVPNNLSGFLKQLNDIKKDTPVDAVVLRKGKKETIKGIKLGDVPANNNPFGGFGPGLPNLQIQRGMFPAVGALPGGGINMSTSRGPGGEFTTRYKEGDIAITIVGKVENGKANVASIEIREGGQAKTYKSVNEVPEEYREDIRVLIRQTESGKTFSIKKLGG